MCSFTEHEEDVVCVASKVVHQSRMVATFSKTCIKLWNLEALRLISVATHDVIAGRRDFHPSSQFLVEVHQESGDVFLSLGAHLYRFDFQDGILLQVFSPNHELVTCMRSADRRLALGTSSGNLYFLDMNLNLLQTCEPGKHNQCIHDLQLTDMFALSGSADNSIHVWRRATGKSLYALLGGSQRRGAVISHPRKEGCSQVLFSDTSIVGVFGNLIRVYNFQSPG